MKHLFFCIFFAFNLQLINAQEFETFSNYESSLIKNGTENELMRVFNKQIPEDSLVLKSVSKDISPTHPLTHLLAKRMLKTVQNPEHLGVGIAAPQVGINRRMMVVQRFDKKDLPFEIFINPEITWQSELLQLGPEGDLSFEERGNVFRNYIINIQFYNLKGEIVKETLEGFTAVIFQHERDHLDGILLTDRIKSQKEVDFINTNESAKLYFQKN